MNILYTQEVSLTPVWPVHSDFLSKRTGGKGGKRNFMLGNTDEHFCSQVSKVNSDSDK